MTKYKIKYQTPQRKATKAGD